MALAMDDITTCRPVKTLLFSKNQQSNEKFIITIYFNNMYRHLDNCYLKHTWDAGDKFEWSEHPEGPQHGQIRTSSFPIFRFWH